MKTPSHRFNWKEQKMGLFIFYIFIIIIIVFNNNNNKNIKTAPVRRRNYFLDWNDTCMWEAHLIKTMIIINQGLLLWISNYNEAF